MEVVYTEEAMTQLLALIKAQDRQTTYKAVTKKLAKMESSSQINHDNVPVFEGFSGPAGEKIHYSVVDEEQPDLRLFYYLPEGYGRKVVVVTLA